MPARFLLCLIAVALSSDATAQWLPKNSGLDFERIRSMHFISASTGFAVGDTNSIFKTTNGGEQWEKLEVLDCSDCTINYGSVWFFGSLKGYIWGRDALRDARVVLATTDGGESWHVDDSTVASANYRSEDFGYTVGISNYTSQVLVTTDLGKTWQQRWASSHIPFYDLADIHGMFGDSLNAVIDDFRHAGHAGQSHESHHYKMYTTDGGKTWHNSIMQPRLFSALGNHRWLGQRKDTVVRSDDGGRTWPGISVPGYPISYFQPLTRSIVYATLGRATDVARSNDAGVTWTREYVADSLTSVFGMQRFAEAGQETIYLLARGTTWTGVKVFKQTNSVSSVKPTKQSSSLRVSISSDGKTLTVNLDRQLEGPMILQDALGRTVLEIRQGSGQGMWTVDLTGISPGVYFVTVGEESAKVLIP